MSRWKHRIRNLICLLLVAYLGMAAYVWSVQDRKIFAPLSLKEAKATRDDFQSPADLGLTYERLEIPTDEAELPIHGFWLPAADDAPVALYLHGQEVTRHNNLHHADCLHELGCSVLVIDYRGYGETSGKMKPTEESVYRDAEVAWNYLRESRRIAADRILIYGHSLGGAIAIDLATRHTGAGGLVVESAFTSVKNMARWRNPLTYSLPLDLLLRHKFDSIEKVKRIEMRHVLFIHGKDDQKVPIRMCEELHRAANRESGEMLIRRGGHAQRKDGQKEYEAGMEEFLKKCFGL